MAGVQRVVDDFELSFEERGVEQSTELWRVVSWRTCAGRRLRHTNWFATERAARKHAEWIEDGRGEVIRIARYLLDRTHS